MLAFVQSSAWNLEGFILIQDQKLLTFQMLGQLQLSCMQLPRKMQGCLFAIAHSSAKLKRIRTFDRLLKDATSPGTTQPIYLAQIEKHK